MKYIFLMTLIIISSGVGAVVNPDTSRGNTVSSFGSADGSTAGTLGEGNTTSGDFGGGNSTAGPLGTENSTAGTLGGSNTTAGSLGGGATSRIPSADIAKPNGTIAGIIVWFITLLNYIVVLLITGAIMFFLYGVFVLMFVGGTNEESRSKGRKFMFWGIVSLFVMVSVWGLVNILKTSFFGTGPLTGPQFNIR
jgi:hypothetical protein